MISKLSHIDDPDSSVGRAIAFSAFGREFKPRSGISFFDLILLYLLIEACCLRYVHV